MLRLFSFDEFVVVSVVVIAVADVVAVAIVVVVVVIVDTRNLPFKFSSNGVSNS